MSNDQTPKKVYASSSHVNLSCCRLCKSVGDNISHSKNLFAKNNRVLLASDSDPWKNFMAIPCHRKNCCYVWYVDRVKGETTTLKLSRT